MDPGLPHRLTVGAPRGWAPMPGLDAARSRLSRGRLPTRPALKWRARVPGQLEHAPAVDHVGAVVVATQSARLVQLSESGKLEWSVRLTAPAAAPPALANDGRRLVVTADDALVAVDVEGRSIRRVSLDDCGAGTSWAPPLPTPDGGLLLARGTSVCLYDRAHRLAMETRIDEPVASVVMAGGRVVALGTSGSAHVWAPPAPARRVGTFDGVVSADAISSVGTRLVAVVDRNRIVELDVISGIRTPRVTKTRERLVDAMAIGRDGTLTTITVSGVLQRFGAAGRELLQVPLWSQAPAGGPGPIAGPVVDEAGGAAVAVGRRLAITTADGHLASSDEGCDDPGALVPQGDGRLIIACTSGLVLSLGDRPGGRGP